MKIPPWKLICVWSYQIVHTTVSNFSNNLPQPTPRHSCCLQDPVLHLFAQSIFFNSCCSDFGLCPEKNFYKNMLNREKKPVTAHTDESSCYTLTSFLLDYQIMILVKIFSVVNFGLCKKSAVVEKKLYEQSSRVWALFWALISIFSRQDFPKETVLCTETLKQRDCLAQLCSPFWVHGEVCTVHEESHDTHHWHFSPERPPCCWWHFPQCKHVGHWYLSCNWYY